MGRLIWNACSLVVALITIEAFAVDVVNTKSANIGQRVVYADYLGKGKPALGTIKKINIPYLWGKPSITIQFDDGTRKDIEDEVGDNVGNSTVWSTEGCSSLGFCMGVTSGYFITKYHAVVKGTLIARKGNGRQFVARVIDPLSSRDKISVDDLVVGIPVSSTKAGDCSPENICVDEEIVFKKSDHRLGSYKINYGYTGKILAFTLPVFPSFEDDFIMLDLGLFNRPGSVFSPKNGYVVQTEDGGVQFISQSFSEQAYPNFMRANNREGCNPENRKNLCAGQSVYVATQGIAKIWFRNETGYQRVNQGEILAANSEFAFVKMTHGQEMDHREVNTIQFLSIDDIALPSGCLYSGEVCVGEKFLVPIFGISSDNVYAGEAKILGIFGDNSVLADVSGPDISGGPAEPNLSVNVTTAKLVKPRILYRQAGCSNSGFCVGDVVRPWVSGQPTTIVGIKRNGELALKPTMGAFNSRSLILGNMPNDVRK